MSTFVTRCRARRRALLFTGLIAVCFFLLGSLLEKHWYLGIVPPEHRCLPYSVWIVRKGVRPGRDAYACFLLDTKTRYGVTKWVKILAGLPGDRIEVRRVTAQMRQEEPDRYREVIDRNGMPVEINIQGYVSLHRQGLREPLVLRVLERSSRGEPVPMIEPQVIPPGKYFLYATAPRSYDSRYWGLVDEKDLLGTAHPVL